MEKYSLNPKHIYLIQADKQTTLFFHTDSLQIYPLQDKILIDFLQSYRDNGYEMTLMDYGKEDFNEIYEFICKKITSAPISPKFAVDINTSEFYTTVLPIASSCNLNCPYCFAQTDGGFHFGDFTTESIDNIIPFIMEHTPDKEKPITIIFFGGEPLLKFDIMEYTVKFVREKYPEKNVAFSVTTNGTILNDKIIKFLKENRVLILLSLDGPEDEYNVRNFKNGENSTSVVSKNIEKFKQNGIPIEIRATMVSNHPRIVEAFDFFEKIQVQFFVVFAYISENKNHNYAIYDTQNLSSIEKQLYNLLIYYVRKLEAHQPIYNKWFMRILDNTFRYRTRNLNPCGAGYDFFTIIADGTIFSCAHLMNDKQYSIGDIYNGIKNKSAYIPLSVDTLEECKDCPIKYLCKGGCFSRKISTGKSNSTAYKSDACKLEQLTWDLYIKLYYHVLRVSPKYFEIKDAEEKKQKEAMSLPSKE
jgi:uncharacterized protein